MYSDFNMRFFLDANVLFAACWNPEGRTGLVAQLARSGLCVLITSVYAFEEARRNLELKRPDALSNLNKLMEAVRLVPEASPSRIHWAQMQGLPTKDAPILAAAVAAGADCLVTGDKTHFGLLYGKTFNGVMIVSPETALQLILKSQEDNQ